MRTQRKFLALIMTLILSLSIIPKTALANEVEEWEPAEQTVETIANEPDYSSTEAVSLAKNTHGQTENENFWYIGADSTRDAVYAYLTEDGTDGDGGTAYTLTVFGSGVMKSYTKAADGQPWTDKLDSITNIVIEKGITVIGDFAFMNAKNAETVILPDGLTKIGQRGFAYCEKLQSPDFPSTLTEIGANPFYSCSTFDVIELPDSLTTMGAMLFLNCTGLKSIKIPTNATSLPEEIVKGCINLKSIQIPENITSVESGAFAQSGLEEAIIPSTVNALGPSLFYQCRNLKKVIFNGNAKVQSATFLECSALKTIIFTSNSFDILQETNNYMFGTVSDQCVIILEGSNISSDLIEKIEKNIPQNKFVITLVVNGGIIEEEIGGNSLATPIKKGYTFGGWYANGDFSGDIVTSAVAGQTYYAKWEPCDLHIPKADDGDCTTEITCSKCGAVTTEAQDSHRFTNYVYNNDATYERDGTKTAKCDRCDVTDTVTAEGTKLVYTHSGGSSSVSTGYPVTASNARNGTVTISPRHANKGTTVTITVKPDKGYEVDRVTVTDKDGKSIKVTEGANNKYTFTMPSSKVTVEAAFAKIEEAPRQNFADVPAGYWAENAIAWASENGYINGNTAATFNPEGTVTRRQLWMILARLSGEQPADFTTAKDWAVSNWLTDGTTPGTAVTRQQLVTILYRYAVGKGYDTADKADLTQFPDHASVAAYATDALAWSVANSIVGGTTQGTLDPNGTATRAQFAVILSRFADKTAK